MSASLRKRLNCCVAANGRDGPEADIGHLAYPRGAMVFEREYRMAQMSRFGWSISRPAEFIGLNAQRCIVN
jgi:hypothetical protein